MILLHFLIFGYFLNLCHCYDGNQLLTSTNCIKTQVFFGDYRFILNPEIRFYLYTRANLNIGKELIQENWQTFNKSNFNTNWPVRIFIHGWKAEHRSCVCGVIKDAYLKQNNFNVIIVDWSDLAHTDLETASERINFVGSKISQFTNFINREYNISYDDIYLIGHSLGAHIAGHAGSLIYPNQYNTIFALDPSAPYFIGQNVKNRLDPSDAKYVESIVTDTHKAGYNIPNIGHASIYPNFGKRYQPGCSRNRLYDAFCNHRMAVYYFAESIQSPKRFCAIKTKWDNLKRIDNRFVERYMYRRQCKYFMGGEPSVKKHGVFYVSTTAR